MNQKSIDIRAYIQLIQSKSQTDLGQVTQLSDYVSILESKGIVLNPDQETNLDNYLCAVIGKQEELANVFSLLTGLLNSFIIEVSD